MSKLSPPPGGLGLALWRGTADGALFGLRIPTILSSESWNVKRLSGMSTQLALIAYFGHSWTVGANSVGRRELQELDTQISSRSHPFELYALVAFVHDGRGERPVRTGEDAHLLTFTQNS